MKLTNLVIFDFSLIGAIGNQGPQGLNGEKGESGSDGHQGPSGRFKQSLWIKKLIQFSTFRTSVC